jgi:PAS domain-containing protein
MAQREIEVILSRQLASYLSTPIFIVDQHGTLVFYNEPAERLLAQRFEETGEMPAEEWAAAATVSDDHGERMPLERLPLMIALKEQRPVHGHVWITGQDGVRRRIATTSFPLIGQAGRHLGAMTIFWEVDG